MQKLKRPLALLGVILLVGMYLITLVLGLMNSPAAQNMLMAAVACTIVIPCVLYGMMLIARVLDNRNQDADDNEDSAAQK